MGIPLSSPQIEVVQQHACELDHEDSAPYGEQDR
jgi:hypothetical protein